LACRIEDIEDQDWDTLRIENGEFSRISRKLFDSSSGDHINYVVFSSNRTPPNRVENVTSFSMTYLSFTNTKAARLFPEAFLKIKP
jgi:hypothetical protein